MGYCRCSSVFNYFQVAYCLRANYHLYGCREETVFYLNVFSGEASLEFPSALTAARGGVNFLINMFCCTTPLLLFGCRSYTYFKMYSHIIAM